MSKSKVLIVATSAKTRGGITSVINAHKEGRQWNEFHCRRIGTHIDRNILYKLTYFIKGWIVYTVLLPFYDIVHIHLSEPISAIRKTPFMLLAKMWRKKVIIHFHAFSPETTIKGEKKRVYKYIFNHADRVIVLSEFWKNTVTETFELGDKVQVIYNPCISHSMPEHYQPKRQILYAGTVNERKGYADMLQAFARIASAYPEWSIVLIGNGELQQGISLSKELGIANQISFRGWLNGAAKDRAFKESAIFCLPSYAEGFPMSVLDAWSYGLPVITTPVGGIPDIAQDGKNMLLFEPGDITALAARMKRMISDTSLRKAIAKESHVLAQTIFNQETINKEIEKLYEELSFAQK